MQIDARFSLYPASDFFAQFLNICAGGVAGVDQEVGVLFRNLRTADLQATATGLIDQLPGFLSVGVLEG